MEDKKVSQSISISGGHLSDVQIGGQAGRDLTMEQSQQIGSNTDRLVNHNEVVALLEQLKELLQESNLSKGDKDKVVRSIETAKDEIQSDGPDKEFAAQNLQRATKVLKDASETVEAGTGLWQKVKPILEAITPWLGVSARFLV